MTDKSLEPEVPRKGGCWHEILRERIQGNGSFAFLILIATIIHLLAFWCLSDFSLFHLQVGVQSLPQEGKYYAELVAVEAPSAGPSPRVSEFDPTRRESGAAASISSPTESETSRNQPTFNLSSVKHPTSADAPASAVTQKSSGHTTTGLNRSRQISIFNLNVASQRVVYLIDYSGSMWNKVDSRTRFQVACDQVRKSIEALAPDMQFDIVMFADHAVVFQPQLVTADEEVKKKAEDFLSHAPDQDGNTDLVAGIQSSMALQPDSIFLLTDGIANMPEWEVLAKVEEMQKALGAPARLYAIGLVDFPDSEGGRLLQKLTRSNGGSFVPYQLWSQEVN